AVDVTSTGVITIVRYGATGSYSISSGTLQTLGTSLFIGDGAYDATNVAAGTVGTFTQTGGTVTTKTSMDVGRRGGNGTYSISAGTLALGGQFNVGTTASSTVAGMTTPAGTLTSAGPATSPPPPTTTSTSAST